MTNDLEVNEMTTEARAARDAYRLLRIGFTVAPILFGLDKFFNWTVHWPDYLAPLDQQHRSRERAGLHVLRRRRGDRRGPGRGRRAGDRRAARLRRGWRGSSSTC